MKPLMISAAMAATALLSGCASAPEPQATQLASNAAAPAPAGDKLTGSRIPRKSTDRTLKAVGNQDYRDDNQIKSMGNEISRPVQ